MDSSDALIGAPEAVIFDMEDILGKVANRYSIDLEQIDYTKTVLTTQTEMIPPYVTTRPVGLLHKTLQNGGSSPIESIMTINETLTDTFEWSITEGLKIGMRTMVEVSFPGITKGEAEITGEVSIGSTQKSTKTRTTGWADQVKITCPPHKELISTAVVETGTSRVAFTIDIKLTGRVRLVGKNGNWVENCIADWVHDFVPHGMQVVFFRPTSGDTPGLISIRTAGRYTGVEAVKHYVENKEFDWPPAANSEGLLSGTF